MTLQRNELRHIRKANPDLEKISKDTLSEQELVKLFNQGKRAEKLQDHLSWGTCR